MNLRSSLVNGTLRFLTAAGCRLDCDQLKKVPMQGPLILTANHINFLETPVIVPRLAERPLTALAKIEYWQSGFFSYLFDTWGFIPIRRGEADLDAFQNALEALHSGKILIVLPEGTRSKTGKMIPGHPGIVLLALRSGAPILPVAHYGGEDVWNHLKHFKRTPFNVVVGNPFRINIGGKALSRDVRQQIVDEVMYQVAALLPPAYRGVYSDFSKASQEYLQFEPGVESNLKQWSITK